MKTQANKRGVKKIAFKTLVLLFVLYLIVIAAMAIFASPLRISIVETSSLEDVLSLDGYIFRHQHLIYSSVGGVLESAVADGERVRRGDTIAVVYMGTVPTEAMEQLRRINEQIARNTETELRRDLFVRDPVAFERREVANEMNLIIDAVYFRDGDRIARARQSLDDLIEKRNLALGFASPERLTTAELIRQRREIETRYGISSVDLIAPSAGVFVSNIDGLENYLQIDRIRQLTPNDIDAIDEIGIMHSNEIVPERAAAKVVNNYEWYFVTVVDTVRIHPLAVGNTVQLRFFDVSDTRIEGRVEYISNDQDGRSVVAISARGYVDSIYSLSRVSVDVIRRTHRGLRIETEAIRVDEYGRTGVFVVRNNMAHFREVNILHHTEEWMIIEEDLDYRRQNIVVRAFDEIVISGRDLSDGDVVRR